MKKNSRWILPLVMGMVVIGCSTKEVSVPKVDTKKSNESKVIKKNDTNLAVEVKPVVDKKLEVVTKVKPEVAVVAVEKVSPETTPIVLVDPIEVNESVDVKKVEVLPVVDNTLGVVAEIEPTIEVAEEIPVKGETAAVVVEPVIEK